MAQTQHNAPHTDNDPAPQHTNGLDADNAAWCKAAEARKYRVCEGKVYSYGSNMIFHLPAVPGFGAIAEGVRPFVFQAIAQMATNRIGQNGDGNVAEKVVKVLTTGEGTPGAQSNDAFDNAYVDHIAALISDKLGPHTHKDGVELKGEELKAAKAARDKIIEASAAKAENKEKHFETAVKAAVERATNVPSSGKAKRTPAPTAGAMDL